MNRDSLILMRPVRRQDLLVRTVDRLENESTTESNDLLFDYDSLTIDVLSGDWFAALDQFYFFHINHPFDSEFGQNSLILLLDIVTPAFNCPPEVLQKILLILCRLSQCRETAETIVYYPSFIPFLQSFVVPRETILLLAQLFEFARGPQMIVKSSANSRLSYRHSQHSHTWTIRQYPPFLNLRISASQKLLPRISLNYQSTYL
jgi:hypothetical protein